MGDVKTSSTKIRPALDDAACISPPPAAYDALAPFYSSLLEARKQYVGAIDQIVVAHAHGARSLLDIGSGNGVRALRIAGACAIDNVVLVEPSDEMRRQAQENEAIWKRDVWEISSASKFDLITCLWNVLGHLDGSQERSSLLATLKTLLSPCGMLFLDVNHRYNTLSYGWATTAARMVRDRFSPSEKNGDVIASWQAGDLHIRTRGHVFTHAELVRLFDRAGLKIKSRWVVDYRNGCRHRFSMLGNLLYQLTA